MITEALVLQGKTIRLEPLEQSHVEGLAAAAAGDPELYRWSPVPQSKEDTQTYVDTALAWRDAGTAFSFAIVGANNDQVIGSSRFFNLERWPWPQGHPLQGRSTPDACEIGYTWFSRSAIRTAANSEAKFLMLRHAFEIWRVFRVCFHTDVRNERSRAALERIGAQFEGKLRAHRMAADFIARDSMRYSIIASEWPDVKRRLEEFLHRT